MKRIGLSTYRKIYWLPLLGLLLLLPPAFVAARGVNSFFPLTSTFFAFLFWLIFGRRIAFGLVPRFVSALECPRCHEEIDAVGIFHCGCGFRDHRQTHLLSKRCPKCGAGASDINCPRRRTTILLW
jgi:hypothetical protein